MYWKILFTFFIFKPYAYAQLTSPDEAVCVGKQVVFSCQQAGGIARWTVELPLGRMLFSSASSSQSNRVATFLNDDFGFTIHILPTSTPNSVHTDLRVTTVRQLQGVRVVCQGASGTFNSTIQVASVDQPRAPNEVMKIEHRDRFTQSTASFTLTWSSSSEADNYTIVVMPPPILSGEPLEFQSIRVQLTVLYNVVYSVNLTAHNCAGSNSTVLQLHIVGCSPPSPPANGRISEHSSGTLGAMLTFQCDTGYIPQESNISTCMSNTSWIPRPECEVIDCGIPIIGDGVVIEPFNDTKFNAVITFHCPTKRDFSIFAVCGRNGEWIPNPASFKCVNGILVSKCRLATAPVNGHINSMYTSTVDGSQITFHCGGDSPVMTSTCRNGSWIPDPADLVCGPTETQGYMNILSTGLQVAITAIISSLVFLIIGLILGILWHRCLNTGRCTTCKSKPMSGESSTPPALYEEVLPDTHSKVKYNIELKENVAYGNV